MAKKTSYLTELIERHERWKAEGGERQDDEEQDLVSDLCVYLTFSVSWLDFFSSIRPGTVDPEDLWDFGTVRHTSRPSTIGRANPGPPLTWENNGTTRSDLTDGSTTRRGSGSSGSSKYASSVTTTKGELPPLPPSNPHTPTKPKFEQSTVRHMRSPGGPDVSGPKGGQKIVQREPSDDYEDYEDQYEYTKPDGLQHKMEDLQLDHEDDSFPDTTMLDSVILPAIASVSIYHILSRAILVAHTFGGGIAIPSGLYTGSARSA